LKIAKRGKVIAAVLSSFSLGLLSTFIGIGMASADYVTAPSNLSIQTNQTSVELSNDFDVSGYAENANLLVSVSLSGGTAASFSVATTTGLTREFGYNSWLGVSSLSFTGTQANVNAALDSLTFNSGNTAGTTTLTVSVQEKISGSFYFEGTGHLYEYVPSSVSYIQARTNAGTRTLNGLTGYLVTITSDEEHNFVLTKIQNAFNIWIALSDRATEGVWVLDPKDGHPEQGTVIWNGLYNGTAATGKYAKWCGGEPNNSGNEDAAVTKWGGGNCWNDLPAEGWAGGIGGYVVEYEPTQTANPVHSDSMEIVVSSPPATTVPTTTVPPTTTTTTPVTTTVAPFYNAVENLTGTANENGSVFLDWDAPTSSNLEPHMYDVSWFDLNNGTESGGWGVWTYAANTSYTVGYFQFPGTTGYGPVRFKIRAGNAACVGEGQGSCVYGPYATVDVTVIDPTPTTTAAPTTTVPPTTVPVTTTTSSTTTTTTTTTTIATPPQTTTTTEYVAPTTTPEYATATTVGTIVPETTIPEETTTTTEPEEIEENEPDTATTSTSIPSPKEDTETTTPDTPDSDEPTDPQGSGETEQDNGEIPQESEDPVQEPSDETTQEESIEVEEIAESIAEASEEEAAEIVESVIDNIVESKTVEELTEEDKEEIAAVVSAVIEAGVSETVAVSLASEPAVLASIDVSQAEEIFSSVDEGGLTEEQGLAIVDAVQEATEEIRGAFEEAINIFAGAFDTYVALGSTIDVGTRKSVIAVAALQASAGAAMVASSSGNIGGSSSSNSNPNDAARREDEEEEEAGEIEGTDLREWLDTISMWIYVNGIRKFSMKQFLKKFAYETVGIGFTISSTVILWVTLSGFTRTVAIVASLAAFAAHYYVVMLKKDE
jgi:hypothetical protein